LILIPLLNSLSFTWIQAPDFAVEDKFSTDFEIEGNFKEIYR